MKWCVLQLLLAHAGSKGREGDSVGRVYESGGKNDGHDGG